ncbi:PREDICTED: cytidine monophosphate-N-acetylneuraminic acid hydroxylase-like [Branchiostoma belcheri]|uniref:Cytidine monophosphate-N-acetylneuraminic acid hydroxylase n=1 Tax=Branchiostoma belcheri TaxID=7741 RepID=A0A6P4YLF2_BRABE|nr:PREDICTED: cytidine monophosphate-N-acetylneuraminic acid hydroxylase-like [Branchiostoma belcheri]
MEQQSVEVLRLTPGETTALRPGVNLICREADNFVIYKDPRNPRDDPFKACRNVCKHQGGKFVQDVEDPAGSVLRCTKHGWKLDCSTMKYVNPPDSFSQERLVPELDEDGSLALVELIPPEPWKVDARAPEAIQPGEVQLTFFAHACMELKLGDKTMFFDPWLTGPAFARGWWLIHEPPADWLDRLSRADLIYISHVHSDHLSYPTLTLLSEKNPDIPIYVGDTSMPVFCKLQQSGVRLNRINVCSFGVWQEINADLRFMILMDGVHPDMDTCILVDYKGHLILNTVDCTQPNGMRLPKNVDIMMSDFAGGASGFPMAFSGGRYTNEWKAKFIATERKKLLYYKTQVVRDVNPKVYCPFAGFFVEAHPADKYIRDTNTKNSAEQLNTLINRYSDHIIPWTPKPGATLDLALILDDTVDRRLAIVDPPLATKIYKDNWDFDSYIDKINESIDCEIFAYPDWIPVYYRWAGFSNYNLVLRMIETDDDFHPIEEGYDFLVDFSDLSFPQQRPTREHAYLEIKNRIGVHRQTVLKGLFWDDLYIGFNNRISRDPDTFHYKFWNHMQILLPQQPPDWASFLRKQQEIHGGKPVRAVWKPSNKSNTTVARLLGMLVQTKALLIPGLMASLATIVFFAMSVK